MAKPSVLVVDDEEAIRRLISEELVQTGYTCATATNANDALSKLEKNTFDVVLLDIILPGMSGIELLKTLQKGFQAPVFIILTGIVDMDIAVEAMRSGASDYIVKPFSLCKLNSSITAVLERRRQQCKVYDKIPNILVNQMDALAFGVEARIDHLDGHSKTVTKSTVELARWLALPEKEIEEWESARETYFSNRDKGLKSLVGRLERNSLAQMVLGLTHSVSLLTQSNDKEN